MTSYPNVPRVDDTGKFSPPVLSNLDARFDPLKNTGSVSVKNYGAIGDGTTDDTASVRAAVTAAYPGGQVYFPDGRYKVAGSIADFWRVDHDGPGVITDGTNDFRPSPRYFGDTNTLWVNSATGSDTNDGMFPGTAFQTMSGLMLFFSRLGTDVARGNWKVRLSGTFNGTGLYGLSNFRTALTIEGDDLDANGEPTTKFVPSGPTDYFGIRVDPSLFAAVKIRKIGFRDFGGKEGGGAAYGILIKDGGYADIEDCTFDNCDVGVGMFSNIVGYGRRLKARDCGSAYNAIYSSSVQWTYCEAHRCTKGFTASRSAVAHVDYAVIEDCGTAINISQNARVGAIGGNFKRNGIVYEAEGGAEYIIDYVTSPVEFNIGTADANTMIYSHRGVSRETRIFGQLATNEFRTDYDNTPVVHTGTLTRTYLRSTPSGRDIPAMYLTDPAKKLRVLVHGNIVNVNSPVTLDLVRTDAVGSTNMITLTQVTIPTGSSREFMLEFYLTPASATIWRGGTTLNVNGLPPVISVNSGTAAINAAATKLKLAATLGNTADKVTLRYMEVGMQG